MLDDPNPIEVGAEGIVDSLSTSDCLTRIDVSWDDGRTLALIVPPDRFEVVL